MKSYKLCTAEYQVYSIKNGKKKEANETREKHIWPAHLIYCHISDFWTFWCEPKFGFRIYLVHDIDICLFVCIKCKLILMRPTFVVFFIWQIGPFCFVCVVFSCVCVCVFCWLYTLIWFHFSIEIFFFSRWLGFISTL